MDKLKCDICDSSLTMQADGKVAICDNCGMKYSIERIREKLQQSNNRTNSGQAFQGWQAKPTNYIAQLKTLIKKYYSSGDFIAAEQTVKKVLEENPGDKEACQIYDELQTFKFMEIKNGVLVKYTGQAESLTLPNCITKIGEYAFSGGLEGACAQYKNKSIQQITIPSSVEEIGTAAFADCTTLSQINLSEGLYSIGNSAFERCSNLTSVTLPNTLRFIGERAFGRTDLNYIVCPESVVSISKYAFEHCKNLSSIEICNSKAHIGEAAFSNCTALKKAILPKSIEHSPNKIFCYYREDDDYSGYEGFCSQLVTIYIDKKLITPTVRYRDLILNSLYGTKVHYQLRDVMEVYNIENLCPHCGNHLKSKLLSRYCNHCNKYIEEIHKSAYYVDLPYNLGINHYRKVINSPWFIELREKGIV